MLPRKRTVTAPDGTRWEVSIDWTRRPLTLPHAYRRRGRRGDGDVSWLGDLVQGGTDDIPGLLAFLVVLVVAGVLLWFVVWPLLALATELLALVLLALAGTLARLLLGRPWIVEAVADSGREERWSVHGMGAAREAIEEIADALAGGQTPAPARLPSAD